MNIGRSSQSRSAVSHVERSVPRSGGRREGFQPRPTPVKYIAGRLGDFVIIFINKVNTATPCP
jgi:hypothetical protein